MCPEKEMRENVSHFETFSDLQIFKDLCYLREIDGVSPKIAACAMSMRRKLLKIERNFHARIAGVRFVVNSLERYGILGFNVPLDTV